MGDIAAGDQHDREWIDLNICFTSFVLFDHHRRKYHQKTCQNDQIGLHIVHTVEKCPVKILSVGEIKDGDQGVTIC